MHIKPKPLNQNLTLNYADSSLPSSTTFNEFAQMVLEKLYPNTIYIVKDGVFQVTTENTPTITGLTPAETVAGHGGWHNDGGNYLAFGIGGNEYSSRQTAKIENVLGKKLKVRWAHGDTQQVSERTITDNDVYVSLFGFNAGNSARAYAGASATKQTSFGAYNTAQSWYSNYGIVMGTSNDTYASRIYDIWIE